MTEYKEAKNQLLEVHYQLQFNWETYAIIGREAMVRYREGGELLAPQSFLPV